MRKCANISPYMGRALVMYKFATAPFRISLYMRKFFFFIFISVPAAQPYLSDGRGQRGLNTKRLTIVFVLGPSKHLSNHADRQAHTSTGTVLVKSRKMTGRT